MGTSADQTSSWNAAATVMKTVPLTTPAVCPAGVYWAAILTNWATTGPSIGRFGALGVNTGRGVAPFRFMTGPSSQTSLPSSVTMSAGGSAAQATWAAVS